MVASFVDDSSQQLAFGIFVEILDDCIKNRIRHNSLNPIGMLGL
jgi:hypothetical protein